jgi:hypothetical protein
MWFIFIVPVTIVGAFGALFGLVNGAPIIVVTLAADQWQRRRGYKPGEGIFTDREGGHIFGTKVSPDGTDLGKFLNAMVQAFPDMFQEVDGKQYDLTESEGKMLRAMVQSAQGQLNEYLEVSTYLDATDPETITLVKYREEQLRAALTPVVMFLQEVPGVRVRKAA